MQTQRILVTGGAGFIGSHLVDRLLEEGLWDVEVLDNFDPFYDPTIKRRNVAEHIDHAAYMLVEDDLRSGADHLAGVLRGGYDVIVHLAAKAGVRPSLEDPVGYRQVNVHGTEAVLELAERWQTPHVVLASSSSVYGVNPNVPWHEELELEPISPYAETKIAAEQLALDAVERAQEDARPLRVLALRFFTVYGPRQRPDLAIHKFARMMRRRETLPLYGDGSSRRDYTFIDDIIQGVRAAIDYDGSDFEIVNLGNNETVELIELVRALERALGVDAMIEHLPEQQGDVPQTWASIEKAKRLLDYQPTTSIDDGLEVFARWLDQVGDVVDREG